MKRKRTVYQAVVVLLLLLLGGLFYVYLTLNRSDDAAAFEAPGLKFIRAIYAFGPNPDQFLVGPFGLAWGNDQLYVADNQTGGVYAFTEGGEFIGQVGVHGRAPGEVYNPAGVAVGPRGEVVVADRQHAKLVVYDREGVFQEEVEAEFPLIPYFGTDGKFYLTVGGGIDVFDSAGYAKLAEWGDRGREEENYDFPNGIAQAPDGTIFVSDGNNQRIKAIDTDGEVVWILGEPPASLRDASRLWGLPGGIALVDGIIYMVDPLNGVIHLVSAEGEYLAELGVSGESEGAFSYPSQIVHMYGSRFAVSEWGNSRVSIVEINPEAAIRAWERTIATSPALDGPDPHGDEQPDGLGDPQDGETATPPTT
jgi:hypothetical protein